MVDEIGRLDENELNQDWLGSLRIAKKMKNLKPEEKMIYKRELVRREAQKYRPLTRAEKKEIEEGLK